MDLDLVLLEAAKRGDIDQVKSLVQQGAAVNIMDTYNSNYTPLIYAIRNNRIDMAEYLIDNGANVNPFHYYEPIPLLHAIGMGKTDMMKYLIDRGADVNSVNYRKSALYFATERRNLDMVKYLVEHGASVNGPFDNEPLTVAVQRGYIDIVKYLIDNGANVNSSDGFWSSPSLLYATRKFYDDKVYREIVGYLIEHGADYGPIINTRLFQDVLKYEANKLKNELTQTNLALKRASEVAIGDDYKHRMPKNLLLRTIYQGHYKKYCPAGNGLPPIQLIVLASILNNTMPKLVGVKGKGGNFEHIYLDISWMELCDKVKHSLLLLL